MMESDKSKAMYSRDVLLIPLDETWNASEQNPMNHVLPLREKEFSRNWSEDENAFLMQAFQKLCFAKEEWVFLFHGRFPSLATLVHEIEMCIHASAFDAALFDEKLEGGIELHYPDGDENLVAGLLENLPSHLLLRRRILLELLEQQKDILYPKVIQKLLHAAKHKGIQIVCTHRMLDRELPCDRLSLNPFSATNMFCGNQGKRILIITHELSRTGAPIVLFEMCVSILKKMGYKGVGI